MALDRRALLSLPAALLPRRARGQAGPPAAANPPGAEEHIGIKIVIEAEYRDAQLKIVDSRSGAVATTYPTEAGREMAFSGRLKKTGCITDYDCVVNWAANLTDTIRLWVAWTRDAELSLVLHPHDFSATRKSVDRLDQLVPKNSRDDAMRCYVGGRRIFQKLSPPSPNRHSLLAINALRLWMEGAIAAYDFDRGFGRDESLVQAIERFRTRAASNSDFRERWDREFERSADLVKQFDLYKTMEFDLYADIPKLIQGNNLHAANIIVEELLRRMEGTQRAAAVDLRGVSRDGLVAFREDIRARGS